MVRFSKLILHQVLRHSHAKIKTYATPSDLTYLCATSTEQYKCYGLIIQLLRF